MKKNISLTYDNTKISGLLLKETEKDFTVKLPSGYQIQILREKCSNIEISKIEPNNKIKNNVIKNEHSKVKTNNKKLPNIAIFHTGGTIASKIDYSTGAVSSHFTPDELISQFEELNLKANLDAYMIGNLMSEDLRFSHYNLILEAIKKHHSQYDGIIISHGTDTMHFTSAALQYSLENLQIPILLVGAQRSSDRASSDAFLNLEASIEFIKYNKKLKENFKPSFNRVGICMHETTNDSSFIILDSINAKKLHSSRRDAFKQINFNPVCNITSTFEITNIRDELFTNKKETSSLIYTPFKEELKIGIFTGHPHLHHEEISSLTFYDGVILSGTGLGHIGLSEFDEISKQNTKNLDAISTLASKIPICAAIQSINGRVNLNVYSSGRRLLESGILGNFSTLTYETQFIKLAYLLSKYPNTKLTNDLWMQNIEGFDIEKLNLIETK